MPNGNGATSKWIIALSVSIILAIGGWAFAAVNGSKANHIEKNTVRIDRNTLDIGVLKTQGGVIITKLEYLEKAIGEVKELVKK